MTLFGSFYPCSQEAQDPGDGTCPTTLSSTPSSTSHSCELSVSVPGPPVRIVAPPAVLHQVSLDILCVHSLCLYLALTFTTYTLITVTLVTVLENRDHLPSVTVPYALASGLFSKFGFPTQRLANKTHAVPRDLLIGW